MVTHETSTRDFLAAQLERRVRANPRYSLRAFARDLGLSPGELSEALNGKRRLTPKAIRKIAERLGLSATETRHLLGAASVEAAGLAQAASERAIELDLFRVVSDWYCFAILNLMSTDGFRSDFQWIGRRLGISATEAKLAVERLERVGLVSRSEEGRLSSGPGPVFSPDGVPSEAIRSYHRQILEKAIAALDEQPVAERDITGIGIALDPKDLPELREDVRRFRDKLMTKYSHGRRTEVYHLELAIFRLTAG